MVGSINHSLTVILKSNALFHNQENRGLKSKKLNGWKLRHRVWKKCKFYGVNFFFVSEYTSWATHSDLTAEIYRSTISVSG